MRNEVVFDINEIHRTLPHRYPFLFVDRIIEFTDSERIVGVKNCTINEPFFQGHFPTSPVMPGVLIMEAIAQIGGVLAKKSTDGCPPGKLIYLVGCEGFKWKRPVVPGDTMIIEVEIMKRKKPLWKMKGEVSVDGQIVGSGIVTAVDER